MAAKPADDGSKKKVTNAMAAAEQWNTRCITEEQAPHKWNEAWGQMFSGGIPHEYADRIAYLEKELQSCPPLHLAPKYGVGPPFKETGARDYRIKNMHGPPKYSAAELDKYNAENARAKR